MTRGNDEEAAVLGAALLDRAAFTIASDIVTEKNFYREQNRLIWRAMLRLSQEDKPIDLVSVSSKLKEQKCLTRAGGSSYLSSLTDVCPDVANVSFYAEAVKTAWSGRELERVGNTLKDDSIPPKQRLELGINALTEIVKVSVPNRESSAGDIASDIFENVLKGNGKHMGIKIGFNELDVALDGINKDDFIVIGARPSVGKSAFTLQVGLNVARTGKHVLYVSPEMSKLQLGMRLLSLESGVPYMRIKSGKVKEDELERVRKAKDAILNLPLIIDDSPDQTIESVRLQARSMQARTGLDLLLVDYLQLLCEGDDSKENVTKVSRGLKSIAKDLHIPVWAVTQLSRQIEYRDDKRPHLSDVRGSGQIEQDCDAVLFIWAPNKQKTEVFIEKNRNGPLGSVMLTFDKETTKFIGEGW
jgi:replicative DNA helicase